VHGCVPLEYGMQEVEGLGVGGSGSLMERFGADPVRCGTTSPASPASSPMEPVSLLALLRSRRLFLVLRKNFRNPVLP
jgi:hypothetical protein